MSTLPDFISGIASGLSGMTEMVTFRPSCLKYPCCWARYRPAESTTGWAPTTMLVVSRWAAVVAGVVLPPDEQAAAASATAMLPTAARDTRPARGNLMVLLQVTGKPNRRLERKQDIFVRAGPNRISAVRDGWGIRATEHLPSAQVSAGHGASPASRPGRGAGPDG